MRNQQNLATRILALTQLGLPSCTIPRGPRVQSEHVQGNEYRLTAADDTKPIVSHWYFSDEFQSLALWAQDNGTNAGIARVEIYEDGCHIHTYQPSLFNLSAFPPGPIMGLAAMTRTGTHTYKARVIDKSGQFTDSDDLILHFQLGN